MVTSVVAMPVGAAHADPTVSDTLYAMGRTVYVCVDANTDHVRTC